MAKTVLRHSITTPAAMRARRFARNTPATMVGVNTTDPVNSFDGFQELIEATYGARDRARGQAATVAWLAEEVGELAKAARKGTVDEQLHELGDVIAWVASLANQLGLSVTDAVARYANGCPRCASTPCACP